MDEAAAHGGGKVEAMEELDDDGALKLVDLPGCETLGDQGIEKRWK